MTGVYVPAAAPPARALLLRADCRGGVYARQAVGRETERERETESERERERERVKRARFDVSSGHQSDEAPHVLIRERASE